MRVRKATHLALTLLVAAGIGVSASAAKGQGAAAPSKSPSAKPRPKTRTTKNTSKTTRRQPGQKAPAPDRISEIQTALAKDGSFSANPNGKWDPATVDAM